MFDAETIRAASRVAKENDWPLAHLLAVAEVESAGKVFAKVHGVDEPVVRFEGHYFYKRVVPHKRDEAVKKGLARAKAGAVKNPASQQERWDRLILPAAELDKQAAYESVSWGLGQVMGAHWKALGYGSVLALADHARRGAAGQIELMARFIRANSRLSKALREGQWAVFAKGYNGPGYRANAYDTKMAAAAKRWAKVKAPAEPVHKPADAIVAKPAPPVAPKPEIAPVTPADGKAGARGVIATFAAAFVVAVVGLFWSAACLLPDFIINWLGYAGRCAGGN